MKSRIENAGKNGKVRQVRTEEGGLKSQIENARKERKGLGGGAWTGD